MKQLIAISAFLVVLSAWLPAQEAEHAARGQAYVFLGPIVSNTRYIANPAYNGVVFPPGAPLPPDLNFTEVGGVNAGFGGEVFIHKGLSMGPEFAFAGPDWSFSTGSAVGVGSVNGSYHFFGKEDRRKVEPFMTGGYSLYWGDRTATESGYNLGGGVNLWAAKHAALRLEVRNQGHIHHFHSQFTRIVAFRVGMTFR